MKKFYLIFALLFFVFSCQENPKTKEVVQFDPSLESNYEELPAYEWLSDEESFQAENYQEKFTQLYEQSLAKGEFENAAAYLIAYATASETQMVYIDFFVKEAVQFYEAHQHEISGKAKTNLCYYLGNQYYHSMALERSFHWLNQALEFAPESKGHLQIQGFTNFALAQNYLRQRELDKTEAHLVAALEIFEEVGDLRNQGTVYLLMHNLYVQNEAYEQAEKIIEKAIDIFNKDKNEILSFSAQVYYVHFYIEQGDTLRTIEQIDHLARYAESYPDISDYHQGILNQFLAFKHIAKKEKDSATYYLGVAQEITEKTGMPDLKMRTLFQEILYANAFKEPLKRPEEVVEFYEQIAASEEPSLQFMYQIAYALYDFYKGEGDYLKANQYAEFIMNDVNKQSKDRLNNQLFEMEIKFETERKEKTILLQEKKLADQNKLILSLVIVFVIVSLLLLLWLFWTKNKSVLKEKALVESFASSLLQKTEDERKRIASDLHDSVSNELVNLRHTIENNQGQLKLKIDFILEEVRNISRNISPTLFDKIGLKSSIEQLIERTQKQHNFFISSEIDYQGGLDNNKELQLYRITQEAITNTLKHAEAAAGKVTITEDEQFVYVEIKDNGKGFDVAKMLEKGNCFGLLNITERTKYLNGTVNFQSDETGTIIQLSIPK